MKRTELTKCVICDQGVMHDNNIAFNRITFERFVVDIRAVQRQHGLELQLGNATLANVMGPDEDIAKQMGESEVAIICDECSVTGGCISSLAEQIAEKRDSDEEEEV